MPLRLRTKFKFLYFQFIYDGLLKKTIFPQTNHLKRVKHLVLFLDLQWKYIQKPIFL